MRLDLQLSNDQERQLLESCVLHDELSSAPLTTVQRRTSQDSFSSSSPMKRTSSGMQRSMSGFLPESQTSFYKQPSFRILPAIQVVIRAVGHAKHSKRNDLWELTCHDPACKAWLEALFEPGCAVLV